MVEGKDSTYVSSLMSDLENLNKFASATLDGDKQTMLDSFNKFSWDDKRVLDHLPKFCELGDNDLRYIDQVFSHLCPKYSKVHSPSFNTMALWFKTRLHLQHQLSPFSFKVHSLCSKMTFNDARFNQDGSCICVANDKGFKILNSNPMVVTCERDLRYKDVGSIGMAEMLYRSNLLALVGNSEYYDIRSNSLTSLKNKFIKPWKQNILTIWDDKKLIEIAQLVFNDSIINIKLLYDLLVVVLKHKVYTYQMSDVSLVNCSNTSYNQNGICSAVSFRDMNIIAYPGKIKGTIILDIYTKYIDRTETPEEQTSFVEIPKTFEEVIDVFEFRDILECGEKAGNYSRVTMKLHVHRSEITSIDLSPNGLLLVTSSLDGRFIKMFDTLSGELIQVFRKSRNFGKVTKCTIDKDMTWLSVITQKPKMYLYELDQDSITDCQFDKKNRRIDYKNSCIFDINNEETDIGRYFKYYKFSIVNPSSKCGDFGLCRKILSGTNLFINSTYSVLNFAPKSKEKIIASSFFIDKETIVVIMQSGRAIKLFFNPSKSGSLKTLFYHNL